MLGFICNIIYICVWGLPRWLVVKNVPATAGATGDSGSIPGSGRSPWSRKWQPTPVLLPGESYGQEILVGYIPRGHKESDTTERVRTYLRNLKKWILKCMGGWVGSMNNYDTLAKEDLGVAGHTPHMKLHYRVVARRQCVLEKQRGECSCWESHGPTSHTKAWDELGRAAAPQTSGEKPMC